VRWLVPFLIFEITINITQVDKEENMGKLENKVAIVTGGGTGIGQGIALEFARAGADIIVASRRLSVLEKMAKEIKAIGRRSLCIVTDVSQKTAVANLVQKVMAEFGKIDVLVNNAATGGIGEPLLELNEDDWDRSININLKGYFLCSQAVGKKMVERKSGNIINIASVAGLRPAESNGVYNIGKAGVVMLTQLLARQLAKYNIRVNAIAPGMIMTPMTEATLGNPEMRKRWENFIPLGHVGEVNDIANAALFLASEASRHVTGHTMIIDGGQLLQYKYGL